jgi:hypothetical protein
VRFRALFGLFLLLVFANGCHRDAAGEQRSAAAAVPHATITPPPPDDRTAARNAESGAAQHRPGRDLELDEKLGGHTLARHVGRTDAELAERLRHERDISSASSYTDRATAERVVAHAIERGRGRIDAWGRREGSRPNLVLHVVERSGPPVGRLLSRGASASRPCDGALVVLRWDQGRRRWFVLTSYPEIAR